MQEVEKLLTSGELEAPTSVKEHLQRNIKRMKADIEKACQETENEKFNTNVTKGLWSKVQEARKYWHVSPLINFYVIFLLSSIFSPVTFLLLTRFHVQEELEVLFPGLNLDDKNITAMADEIGQFVLYSYINVQYFQKELAKLEVSFIVMLALIHLQCIFCDNLFLFPVCCL